MTKPSALPAIGRHTNNGRPIGFSSLTPFLALESPDAAARFYTDVFGARLVSSSEVEGVIIHAELDFGHGRLQFGAPQAEYSLVPINPESTDAQFSLAIYVPDVDHVVEAALAHGAVLRERVQGFASGDRFGSVRDPFGVRWTVMTPRRGSQRRGISTQGE